MLLKLLPAVFVCVSFASPQTGSLPAGSLPTVKIGKETFRYRVEWRLFTAGKAIAEFGPAPETASPAASSGSAEVSRPAYQLTLHLESMGVVSKLFKVEDDYIVSLNSALCAEASLINAHEGGRQRETRIIFDGQARKAHYLERDRLKNSIVSQQEIEIPECVHDVIGGLFFLRTLDLEPGQSTQVPVSDGKKSVMAKVEAQQREDVKTPAGVFKTVRYEVYLFSGVLYKRAAHLYVWLTEDQRKLPVQIRVRMPFTIGTINLVLEKPE